MRRTVPAIALTFLACACAGAGEPHHHPSAPQAVSRELRIVHRDTALLKSATARFRDLDSAVAAGYLRRVPRCLANGSQGTMGYHHPNRSLLDDRVELERPEMLLYTRDASGQYQLNGVEYIVPYSALPRDARPPRVMGQELKRSDGLQLWYLHVWIWTPNPAGLFADWNPAISCTPSQG